MSNVLDMAGVKKSYNQGLANEINVLRGCDLTIGQGEVVALVAPSGSGKSTLLHIAGLLDQADEGDVVLDGTAIAGLSDRRRTSVGLVSGKVSGPQRRAVAPWRLIPLPSRAEECGVAGAVLVFHQ